VLSLTSAQLQTWIAAFLWPLTRILGLIATAPLFGNIAVPVSVKVILGSCLALIIAPSVPAMPAMDPTSYAGLLIIVQQAIIGISMGFAMRIVFSAIEMAGEISGMTMGFGFASFFDPQSQGHSSAIAQFLSLLALMIYLATNMHLVMLSALADSFQSMPISAAPLGIGGFKQLAAWGGRIFSSGVQISLPIVAALLITNIALGILTRAAPQLNLFAIGFPVTIGVGFVMIMLVLPFINTPLVRLFQEAVELIAQMTTAALPPLK
jgi:flagellar biosynthetic protein FliR